MSRTRGYIAFAFGVLFAFPIVWQTVHIYHHAQHRSFMALPERHALGSHEGQCPICSYEFAKYEDGEKVIALSPQSPISLFPTPKISSRQVGFTGFNLNFRGPPTIS